MSSPSHGDTVPDHARHVLCGCVERHSGDVLHWIVHPNEIGFRWFEMIISIELCVSLANLWYPKLVWDSLKMLSWQFLCWSSKPLSTCEMLLNILYVHVHTLIYIYMHYIYTYSVQCMHNIMFTYMYLHMYVNTMHIHTCTYTCMDTHGLQTKTCAIKKPCT